MHEIDGVFIAVFDIFDKSSLPSIKTKLNGLEYLHKPLQVTLGHEKSEIQTEIRDSWKMSSIDKLISMMAEYKPSHGATYKFADIQSCINQAFFVGLESDELPFYALCLVVRLDSTKFSEEDLLKEVDKIAFPLRVFMEKFEGITPSLYNPRPCIPSIVYSHIKIDAEELKHLSSVTSQLLQLQNSLDATLDKRVELSAELRRLPVISKLLYDFNLLSCSTPYSNVMWICGHAEQIGLVGLLTPFLVALSDGSVGSSDAFWLDHFSMSGMMPKIDSMHRVDYAISSFIFFLSNIIWLDHLILRLKGLDDSISKIRNRIARRTDLLDEIDELIIELNKTGTSIGTYSGELSRLKRVIEHKLDFAILGNAPRNLETTILPSTSGSLYVWSEFLQILHSDGRYIKTLVSQIQDKLSNVISLTDALNNEISRLSVHISSLSNVATQKSMKKYAKYNWILGLAIAGLTAALLYLTNVLVLMTK